MKQKILQYIVTHHIMFAVYFAGFGGVLAWYHKLDVNFIGLIAAIHTFLFAHSVKEAYFAFKNCNNPPTDESSNDQK